MTKHPAQKIIRFLRSEEGPAAVEYAIMLAFIMLAAFSAIMTLGQSGSDTFELTANKMPGQ